MPISQNTYTVPNNFVQQYDLGQKKIRADLVDENFTDAAGAINTLLTSVATNDAAAVHLTGAETISGDKTFTGTNVFGANTTGVTATAGDNSTKYATTAYADNAAAGVAVSPSSSTPAARSTSGSVGTSTAYARADHSHPNNWGSSTIAATSPAVVIETWHSGTEFYRIWSDGWIEQGGKVANNIGTITFNKPFADTNYTFVHDYEYGGTNSDIGYGNLGYLNKTTTNIQINKTSNSSYLKSFSWYACGF